MGIIPGELLNMDVDMSYQFSNKVDLDMYDDQAKPKNLEDEISDINILELITISDSNKYYKAWKGFVVLHSLVSSYFYAYMAAFESP